MTREEKPRGQGHLIRERQGGKSTSNQRPKKSRGKFNRKGGGFWCHRLKKKNKDERRNMKKGDPNRKRYWVNKK